MAGMILFATIAVLLLPQYIPWTSVNFLLGLAALPIAVVGHPTGQSSGRLFWWALAGALIALFLHSNFLLLAVLLLAIAWQWEIWQGKLPLLAWGILAFMTPAVQYVAVMASFPLRLWLTGVAAKSITMAGLGATAAGNIITMKGHEYSVDPACMGLKMLVTSLLAGLMVIAILQKRHQRHVRWWQVALLLTSVFVLNIIANLLRIVTLVYFDIGPTKTLHELTGLAYLGVYVLLPTLLLANWVIRRWGYEMAPGSAGEHSPRNHFAPIVALAAIVCLAGLLHAAPERNPTTSLTAIEGYTASRFDADVARYAREDLLVYIKATSGIMSAEHNPGICWLGSGYELSSICEEKTKYGSIYTSVLAKGNERLYTAWWYDNGTHRTTSQLEWRWMVLTGAHPFSIINVTAATRAELEAATQKILQQGVFKAAL